MVEQINVTAAERELSTLSRIDYEDTFLVGIDASDDRTAEQWARATLEGAPPAVQRRLRWAWRALGLRLTPTTSQAPAVLGWRIRRQSPHAVLLTADSAFGMSGELLFKVDVGNLVFATFAHHANPLIRYVWSKVTPHHVRVVAQLLRRAEKDAPRQVHA